MIATIYGRKTTFCDAGCRDSFREDRKRGLIYGSIRLDDGTIHNWEEGSRLAGTCAYCNAAIDNTRAPRARKGGDT